MDKNKNILHVELTFLVYLSEKKGNKEIKDKKDIDEFSFNVMVIKILLKKIVWLYKLKSLLKY